MKTKAKKYSTIPTILKRNKNNATISGFLFMDNTNLVAELIYKTQTDASKSYLYSSFSNVMIAEIMDE